MDSVRPKRLKKRQTGRVGAVEAEFFNGLLEAAFWPELASRIRQDAAKSCPSPPEAFVHNRTVPEQSERHSKGRFILIAAGWSIRACRPKPPLVKIEE